jgi:GNAT superfamily N-acetyltransferase
LTLFRIEKLARTHPLDDFNCGDEALNRFLSRYALPNQQANASQTYLALADDRVIGFYTLVVGEVAFEDAADRLKKGLARHPIPVMLLARMGVDVTWQGQRIGSGLLKDAIRRTVQAADIAGIRAFIVHAKNEQVRDWYQRFDLIPSPTDPLHLYVLVKDLQRALENYR